MATVQLRTTRIITLLYIQSYSNKNISWKTSQSRNYEHYQ